MKLSGRKSSVHLEIFIEKEYFYKKMIPMKRLFTILLACIVCQGVSFAQQYASTVETFRIAGKVTDMHDGYNVIDARVEISWEKRIGVAS